MSREKKIEEIMRSADFIIKELAKDKGNLNIEQFRLTFAAVSLIKAHLKFLLRLYVFGPEPKCAHNWVEGWTTFDFTGQTPQQITDTKNYYEKYIYIEVAKLPPHSITGEKYSVVKIEWRLANTGNPNEYIMFVCLDPPVKPGPGGPGSTTDPTNPDKP